MGVEHLTDHRQSQPSQRLPGRLEVNLRKRTAEMALWALMSFLTTPTVSILVYRRPGGGNCFVESTTCMPPGKEVVGYVAMFARMKPSLVATPRSYLQ